MSESEELIHLRRENERLTEVLASAEEEINELRQKLDHFVEAVSKYYASNRAFVIGRGMAGKWEGRLNYDGSCFGGPIG